MRLKRFLFSTLLLLMPAITHAQSITAVWDPNPPEDQIFSYQVCIGTTPLSCNVELATVPASETSYSFTPNPGILYRVAVRAVNASGVGSYSPEVTVSIPGLTQPANQTSVANVAISPLSLSASDPDGSSLTFTHSGLPFGLSLNSSTGIITGTPTSSGVFNVTVFVSDDLNTTQRSFVWTVQPANGSDTSAPSLSITSHTAGQTVNMSSITLAGTATDSGSGGNGIVSVTVNGAAASGGTANGSNTANWSRSVSLSTGVNPLTVVATDGAGNVRTLTLTITRSAGTDTTAPALAITSHTSNQTVGTSSITLSGTASDNGSGGSGITSVTVNGLPASGGTATGSNTANWSRTITLMSGANTVTVIATDGAGNGRAVPITITYSAPSVVSAISATPSSGSGATQTFALQYSDSNGATNLSKAWVWFNATFASTSTNSCMLYYDRTVGRIFMLNDGSTWMQGTLGSSTTLQNSQCTINLAGSSVALSGTTLTLNVAMTFRSTYAGGKNVYMYGQNGTTNSDWQARGTWTVPGTGGVIVTADAVTPNYGSGASQTFSLTYSDTLGATDLSNVWVWFNGTFASTSSNSCMVYYDRPSSRILLLNDGSTWMPGTPGSGTTLQNSQCAVNLAGSSVTLSGNTLTLNLAMTFRPGYAGAKSIYMYGRNATTNSGWQTRGAWTVPGAGGPLVTADSATPNAGSGATQTFSLRYSDTLGATDLSQAWVWFNGTFASTSTNSCMLYYDRPSGRLMMLNDSWTWMSATLGSGSTMQNRQCAVDLAGSSVTLSGNTLTLNLAMTFKLAYAGTKNIYMYAANVGNASSGWHGRGTWTAP